MGSVRGRAKALFVRNDQPYLAVVVNYTFKPVARSCAMHKIQIFINYARGDQRWSGERKH